MSNRKIEYKYSLASNKRALSCWSKENKISPRLVRKWSKELFLFDCDKCEHSFMTTPDRISLGYFCSFCANRTLCQDLGCHTCKKKSFESHPNSEYWSKKNKIQPRFVFRTSNKKFLFDCIDCGHEFEASLCNVSNGGFCSFCANKILCQDFGCHSCKEKSFESNPKSVYWSKKNKVEPRFVFKSSNQKFLFDCIDCGHEFEAAVSSVSNGSFCPFCASIKLCDEKHCNFCFEKSFKSHKRARNWSKKNKVSARSIFKASNKKFWFDCEKCEHSFSARPNDMQNNEFCPYCANTFLCEESDCKSCKEKSFESCFLAIYWSHLNEKQPRDVFKSSHMKYKFDCPYCDKIYEARLYCISNNGCWCNCTKNKTEVKLHKFLESNYGFQIDREKKFDWCKNKTHLRFDFFIEEYNLIIELDGKQHFKQVSNWVSPEETQKKDIYKMKLANKHGYTVIRIYQEDVYSDKNNWQDKLSQVIRTYHKPRKIFIGDIYTKYDVY